MDKKVFKLKVSVDTGPGSAFDGRCFVEADTEDEARQIVESYLQGHQDDVDTFAIRGPFKLAGKNGEELAAVEVAKGAEIRIIEVEEFSVSGHIKAKLLDG